MSEKTRIEFVLIDDDLIAELSKPGPPSPVEVKIAEALKRIRDKQGEIGIDDMEV